MKTGWVVGIAAIGMMFGLTAVQISNLETWNQATQPGFVGMQLANIGTVIAAFVGGKLIPTQE